MYDNRNSPIYEAVRRAGNAGDVDADSCSGLSGSIVIREWNFLIIALPVSTAGHLQHYGQITRDGVVSRGGAFQLRDDNYSD